jgi:hypothetical protein
MSHIITASATINGVDDETFGSNDFGHAEFTRETVLGDAQPQNVMRMQCRWGGECRVELDLTGQLLDNEDVRISGVALLFEGTSEDTNDLDGRTEFTFLVPRGKTVSNQQQVKNTDEGGDFATIDMSVSNILVKGSSQGLHVAQGLIYYIDGQNRLMWNRHDGRSDGSFRWAEPTNREVGTGWDFKHVFSGGDGVIYYIDGQNRLMWNRHDGRSDGSFRWAEPTNRQVGSGWDFKHVFSE